MTYLFFLPDTSETGDVRDSWVSPLFLPPLALKNRHSIVGNDWWFLSSFFTWKLTNKWGQSSYFLNLINEDSVRMPMGSIKKTLSLMLESQIYRPSSFSLNIYMYMCIYVFHVHLYCMYVNIQIHSIATLKRRVLLGK